MDKNISLLIRSKQGLVFDDKVIAVSSYNEKGLFDVLGHHENFISLIKDKIIILKIDNQRQEIEIENGVISVVNNKIEVFVGI